MQIRINQHYHTYFCQRNAKCCLALNPLSFSERLLEPPSCI
ncbi:hypothetical protein [Frischella perrara]|nr:hypothetical protein [Frischella perrara]